MRRWIWFSTIFLVLSACGATDDEWLAIGHTDSLTVQASKSSIRILAPSLYSVNLRTVSQPDSVTNLRWMLDCFGERVTLAEVFSDSSQMWFTPPSNSSLSLALATVCPIADSLGIPGEDIRWLHVTTGQDSTEHWLDLESVERSQDTANAWIRLTGPPVDSQFGNGSRALLHVIFACNDHRYRNLAYVAYDSSGTMVQEEEASVVNTWESVIPQTIGEVWEDNACER